MKIDELATCDMVVTENHWFLILAICSIVNAIIY
tara:strand:- start:864 stop:965 length:102 start_codon:yes stop_codon:yes gene_type:complete